ncbi:MAG: glycosyltransferase family 4 protein [Acinetobacter sp.]
MRIALIPSSDLSYDSGSIIHAKRLFLALIEKGHDVHMVGSKIPKDIEHQYLSRIYIDEHILDHPIINDREVTDEQLMYSFSSSFDFLQKLHREKKIDVVHAQYLSFTSLAAAAFSAATGVPCVISSFGRDLSIGLVEDKRLAAMAIQSLSTIAHVIVPNETVKKSFTELLENRSLNIPITIIPQSFDQNVLKIQPDLYGNLGSPLLATVNSCFTKEKGIDEIIQALPVIRERFPHVTLLIAGADDHPLQVNKNRLLALCHELDVVDAVRFVGYLDRSSVGSLLAKADLFIDARKQGNFSSVLLEAQFMGVATLCSDVEAARTIITSQYNGEFFEPGNWQSLATKVITLISSPSKLVSLRSGAVDWRMTHGNFYLENNAMSSIESIYHSLAEGCKVV